VAVKNVCKIGQTYPDI